MQYYYSHDYIKLFNKLGFDYMVVKTFDQTTKTRMYLLWRK